VGRRNYSRNFTQADSLTARRYGSTGLGLAVASDPGRVRVHGVVAVRRQRSRTKRLICATLVNIITPGIKWSCGTGGD
jgi:hypothetical protein